MVRVVSATDTGETLDVPVDDELRRYANLIGTLGDIPTEPVRLTRPTDSSHTDPLAPPRVDTAALVVIHPSTIWAAPTSSASQIPTVTDYDALAITLTAAVLTALSRAHRPTSRGRVMIVGDRNLPYLATALVAAEAGEITVWNAPDAARFPLSRVAVEADVIVNLLGATPALDSNNDAVVITPDRASDPLLVLPGLARALWELPDARFDSSDVFGGYYDVCHSCALALVMDTPPDQLVPAEPSRELNMRIAATATRAFREARGSNQAES